jgi:CRP/FNR family cyclic AMP-dependent transcriptional regulator
VKVSEPQQRAGVSASGSGAPSASEGGRLGEVSSLVAGTFLATLSDSERESLLGVGVMRSYPRGAALMFQGEPDDRVVILLAGRVKVARVEHDGRELMLDIRDPGDLLGELAFIDGAPRIASVVALEPVQALVTPAAALRGYLESTPRVAVVLLEVVAMRFRDSSANRSQFAVADTMGRLAARILELAERYGEASSEGIRIASPLSQEDLGAWTGASRAGVAEALRVLRELGWVQTERRTLIVRDLDALRARAA